MSLVFENYSFSEVTYLLTRLNKAKSFLGSTENADRIGGND